jgi:hypothetical protein
VYSTQFDAPINAVAIDQQENIYLAGSQPDGIPITPGALQPAYAGGYHYGNAYLAKLDWLAGALLYSTYFGGSRDDQLAGMVLGPNSAVYLAGSTSGGSFPTTSGAVQTANAGGKDAFVARIDMSAGLCSFQLSPANQAFAYSGGAGAVTITAQAGCIWTAVANGEGITITGATWGNGSGALNFSVAPNNSTQSLTGTIEIAGQSLTVTQSGAPCTSTLQPASRSFTASGGTSSFTVNIPTGCYWNAASTVGWTTLSPTSGYGSGSITITAAQNTGVARTGTVVAGGQILTVNQVGVTSPGQTPAPADFNGDGRSDVLWQDPVTGLAQIWLLGGPLGTAITGAANLTASNTWRIVGAGDFNGDGHPDVVWQDPVTGASQVWFLGGAQGNLVTGSAVMGGANTWRIMSVADFNGDGHPDCIWQDTSTGMAQIWLTGGAQGTTVVAAANLTAKNTWRIAGTGDFDGDGHPDVVWQDPVTGAVQVWYLTGTQGNVVSNAVNLSGATSSRIVSIADFNGDRHPDLVWQDATGVSQVWFMGGAQGTTQIVTASLAGANSWRVAAPR